MSSQKLMLISLFLIFLNACSLLQPYIDRRRNPGVQDISRLYSGPSKPDKPVICYNGLWSNEEELQKLADEECVKQGTGTHAEFVKKTYLNGKLLLPNHVHYQCVE